MDECKWKHTLPCEGVVRVVLSYTPLCAHSFLKFNLSGVPGNGLPRLVCINNPMLNMAIPELFSLHGRLTLNSDFIQIIKFEKKAKNGESKNKNISNSTWPYCPITFGLSRNLPPALNRYRWRMQNIFVQRLQPIEVIIVLLFARHPCKVHCAHFGRNDGQIFVEVWVFDVRRHLAILNGINFDEKSWGYTKILCQFSNIWF